MACGTSRVADVSASFAAAIIRREIAARRKKAATRAASTTSLLFMRNFPSTSTLNAKNAPLFPSYNLEVRLLAL